MPEPKIKSGLLWELWQLEQQKVKRKYTSFWSDWMAKTSRTLPELFCPRRVGADEPFRPGTYFLDGSGGGDSRDWRLRRCGFAFVKIRLLVAEQVEVVQGAYGPLPEEPQTVPRAETFALLACIVCVEPGDLLMYSDNKGVVEHFNKHRTDLIRGPNSDLWAAISEALDLRTGSVELRKVKAHGTAEHLRDGTLSPFMMAGNAAADELAGRGAALHQVDSFAFNMVKALDRLTFAINERAVAIVTHLIENFPRNRLPKAPLVQQERLSIHELERRSGHLLVYYNDSRQWRCIKCLRVTAHPRLRAWLQEGMCPGMVLSEEGTRGPRPELVRRVVEPISIGYKFLHPSHWFSRFRGLVFCQRCGYYATTKPKNLKDECRGHPTVASRHYLNNLRSGRVPHPNVRFPEAEALAHVSHMPITDRERH